MFLISKIGNGGYCKLFFDSQDAIFQKKEVSNKFRINSCEVTSTTCKNVFYSNKILLFL